MENQEGQKELPLTEAPESDGEIARRLEAEVKRDDLLRKGGRKIKQMRYVNSDILFARELLGIPLKADYHGEIFRRIDTFKDKHHLWLGPRMSLKTSAVVSKSLHWAVRDPNENILLYGETNKNSLRSLRAIKEICENNEKFLETYGVMGFTGGPTKWTDEELYFMGRKKGTSVREPTFSAGGLDVAMTGGHFSKIVCDDLVTDKNTQSKEQIEKTYETFLTLFPLLKPGGQIIVLGTYWDVFDLYNTIQEKHSDDFMAFIKGGFGEPGLFDGEAILPEYGLTREFLLKELNRPGNRARACMWYFSVCVDEEKQPFKEKDKQTWNPTFRPLPKDLNICITVDPASSVSETACDTAIVVAGMDSESNLWEIEHVAGQFEPMQTIGYIFDLCAKHQPTVIGIESASFYNYLKSWLDIEMRKRNAFLPITPLEGWKQKSKHDRIMMMQPRWINHALILREDSKDLMDQFYRYPKGKRIDLLDAFAYQEEVQLSPFIQRENRIYYNKEKFKNLSDNERLIWSRFDPNFVKQRELNEQNRRDAACR